MCSTAKNGADGRAIKAAAAADMKLAYLDGDIDAF